MKIFYFVSLYSVINVDSERIYDNIILAFQKFAAYCGISRPLLVTHLITYFQSTLSHSHTPFSDR